MESLPTISLYPAPDQIETLRCGAADAPVVMVNLLRFKPRADAPDGDVSGEEAFHRYAEPMTAYIASKGARVIWVGKLDSQVIGRGGDAFDMVAVVEYPSRRAFMEIATDAYVQDIAVHRSAGLEGQWLLAAATVPR